MVRCLILLLAICTGNAALADNTAEALLAKNPEAEMAFSAGERRHIVLPVCGKEPGEVMPGWSPPISSEFKNTFEQAQRPIVCADYGDDPKHYYYIKVVRWVERYNRKLLELDRVKKQ